MANSKIAEAIKFVSESGSVVNDSNVNVLTGSDMGEWAAGVTSPRASSSASQRAVDHDALLDPGSLMRSVISCGGSVQEALQLANKYYDLLMVQSAAPSEMSSQVSALTGREKRQQLWRQQVSAMPYESGYCYLHVVRWSHRKYLKGTLGPGPKMRDFVSLLRPEDLDYAAAAKVGVYRLKDTGMEVEYHLSYESQGGERIGSFASFLSCMLRLYPMVNAAEFGLSDDTLRTVPLVGRVGWTKEASRPEADDTLINRVDTPVPSVVEVVDPVTDRSLATRLADLRQLAERRFSHVDTLNGWDGMTFRSDTLSLTVKVVEYQRGETLAMSDVESGADYWIFDHETVSLDGGLTSNGMRSLSDSSPSCYLRMAGSNLGRQVFDTFWEGCCVQIHLESSGALFDCMRWIIGGAGLQLVTAVEPAVDISDFSLSIPHEQRNGRALVHFISYIARQCSVAAPAMAVDRAGLVNLKIHRGDDVQVLAESVRTQGCVHASFEVGAGKSTQVPVKLMRSLDIPVLQVFPSEIFARGVARYMASGLDSEECTYLSSLSVAIPRRGIVIMTHEHFRERLRRQSLQNYVPFCLYMDCVLSSSSASSYIRDVAPALPTMVSMVLANETVASVFGGTL